MDTGTWIAVVAAVISLVAVVIAARQARYARREATIAALLPFYDEYNSEPMRKIRAFAYRSTFTAEEMTPQHEDDLRQLLSKLEFLGALVDNKLVDFNVVKSIFHHSVTDVWQPQIRAYICAQRHKARLQVRDYGSNYEKLVKRYNPKLPAACDEVSNADMEPFWRLEQARDIADAEARPPALRPSDDSGTQGAPST